jgi:hypothetical protein
MLDPVGGFGRIVDFFISYVETAFRIADRSAAESRHQLLLSPDALSTDPYIEPVLRYETSPRKLEQLINHDVLAPISPAGRIAFVEMALSGLFDGEEADPASNAGARRKSKYPPYLHQEEMLRRGIRKGQPGIVTSGTGSGKTEGFMLPVLAKISDEASRWPAQQAGYLESTWWRGSQRYQPRRNNEDPGRPCAMRAIIVYPMNALVDDQMVRLRKTLDSERVHRVMDERFRGNRIFFGQYTSATPVTGHARHPRRNDETEQRRRQRRTSELRRRLRLMEQDQNAARQHDEQQRLAAERENREPPEQTRYIFPSLDGGEMVSRWDIQRAPPDVLVTNASMLGAMLSREVEDTMFQQTHDWLRDDPDAYFYLIFDELHLIRGSAGTEVAFLVKSLLQRLGLDDPGRMHKLRILASSASMPLDGEPGLQSLRYLHDLFAPYGTSTGSEDPGSMQIQFWRDCVVPGRPHLPERNQQRLSANPFQELLAACDEGREVVASVRKRSEGIDLALQVVAREMQIPEKELQNPVIAVARKAAEILVNACRTEDVVRATSVTDIAHRTFHQKPSDGRATRGLLLARSLPESEAYRAKMPEGTTSFRFHGFIRNIEGLFAAPVLTADGVQFRDLTVERGTSHGPPPRGQVRGSRLFELLYCEACGDLLLGGQRGQPTGNRNATELLPSAADLEGLPEKGASEYYDQMLFEQFAVFWPRLEAAAVSEKQYDRWERACLDPQTGVVTLGQQIPEHNIGGYLYYQTDEAITNARGVIDARRMAQPFCCPKCGTDYSLRPKSSRSRSPIRAFRTGVSKASQLVATELFELLHAIGADPKSIVFSDSRQDAANQSLDIERLHLRDLRREVLVSVARDCMAEVESSYVSQAERNKIMQDLSSCGEFDRLRELILEWAKLQDNPNIDVQARKIRLDELLQFGANEGSVSRMTAEFVRLGIHPFDEVGHEYFNEREWWRAFVKRGDNIHFAPDAPPQERAQRTDHSKSI